MGKEDVMAKREITRAFEVEDGVYTQGTIKVLVSVSEGKGPSKLVFAENMVHYLDYTGTKVEDVLDSAAANDVVSLQNAVFRPMGKAVLSESGKTTSMSEFYGRERRAPSLIPPEVAVLRKDMDKESLESLIAALQAKLENK
jgi:hypothetical protein